MGARFGQWEFPEDSASPADSPVSVVQLTRRVRAMLESGFRSVRVIGEVSNLRKQPSGHIYFTLKGDGAQISCVLFRSRSAKSREALEDGGSVIASGSVTVYEPRGQYQLTVSSLEKAGVGALWRRFEELKGRLSAEGLFDTERKRSLPKYVFDIGLVTSESGAALRDVAHVVFRRFPGARLCLAPTRVQGDGAAAEICEAIARLERWSTAGRALDVILVTRGGGSLEDLWAFNEESVVRAIAACRLPTVSAIGHETDQLLSDYAADLRAATPSAAAEALTAGTLEAASALDHYVERGAVLANRRLREGRLEVARVRSRLSQVHPRRRLERGWQRLDELNTRRCVAPRRALSERRSRWGLVRRQWRGWDADSVIGWRRERLSRARERGLRAVRERLSRDRERLERCVLSLRGLDPQGTLDRGYSITVDAKTGAVVTDAGQLTEGALLQTRLGRGEAWSEVVRVAEREP